MAVITPYQQLVYQHYKGDLYRVLEENAKFEEDGDPVVVYRRLDSDHPQVWVRRRTLFFGSVEHEGATVPRFRLVSPSELQSMVKAKLKEREVVGNDPRTK